MSEVSSSSLEDRMLAMDEVEQYHRFLGRDIRSIIFIETKEGVHYFEVSYTVKIDKTEVKEIKDKE